MNNNSKFIGVVTDVVNEHSFIFRSDNNVKCQIGQIVGLYISDDLYILATIEKIEIDYFLTNSRDYFTSLASDNKLIELVNATRSPKYSQYIKASYIGIYEYNHKYNHFTESILSINSFTPYVFQEVKSFNFECVETVYGLRYNIQNYFKLGTFLYPNYFENNIPPDVNISTDTFNSHTLISGVTGSGKSRLTALIANQLSVNGGHITIIDPHNEYVKFLNTDKAKVAFYSKKTPILKDYKNIVKRCLNFTSDYLTLPVLDKLLPNLSDQQYEYLSKVFEELSDSNSKSISLKNILDITIQKFNHDYIEEGHNYDILSNAQSYAKEDVFYPQFIKRFVWYINKEWSTSKNRPGKAEVAFSLLRRLVDVFNEDIFSNNPNIPSPQWLDFNIRNSINIMNVVYDSNMNNRRFVNTIIQCFFTQQNQHRTLVVDEAHLLLNEKSEKLGTSSLLSRLLRESRKFNLSIIFITQNEIDVPEEIKSQFQNRFRFREEDDQALRYLNNQTCICSIYKGKLSFPMRVDNVDVFK